MTLELKNNSLFVVGWCDTSEDPCYKQLAEGVREGHRIICNTKKELNDDELCAFLFYDEYSKSTLHAAFSGRIEYLGPHPDLSEPRAYAFYAEKEIKVSSIVHCECCGDPGIVILKSKKL